MSVEIEGLRNQINRLEVLRVATCAKSHAFKKYTNEQLENIIEDLKDVLLGLEEENRRDEKRGLYPQHKDTSN
jgi:archaellum component FlaC